MNFYVAGVRFHKLNTCIKEIEVGQKLTLEPEPTNKFDPNAIKILYKDIMLGYVPAKLAAEVLVSIELGKVECTVKQINPTKKPWERLKVSIEEGV